MVVELGCSLETQCSRCDDGRVQWICVDVPEAIAESDRQTPGQMLHSPPKLPRLLMEQALTFTDPNVAGDDADKYIAPTGSTP